MMIKKIIRLIVVAGASLLMQGFYLDKSFAQDVVYPKSLVCKALKKGRYSSYNATLKFKHGSLGYSVSGNLQRKANNGKLLANYKIKGTWEFFSVAMGVANPLAVNGHVEYKRIITMAGSFVRSEDYNQGDYWTLGFYKTRPDKPWLKLKCNLTKVVYPDTRPTPVPTATPIPPADIYVFLITNAGDTLFVGSEPEIYGKALCLIEGAGTDCDTKVIYKVLVGPYATDQQALTEGICANITALRYNKLVPWGPWVRWGTGDLWYRLFDPSAEAALSYCPNVPLG